jgi:hypothetical protein
MPLRGNVTVPHPGDRDGLDPNIAASLVSTALHYAIMPRSWACNFICERANYDGGVLQSDYRRTRGVLAGAVLQMHQRSGSPAGAGASLTSHADGAGA